MQETLALTSSQYSQYSQRLYLYLASQLHQVTLHIRHFWYQSCRVRITLLPHDRKLAQLAHILLGVSKSKTMRRLQDKGRGQSCHSSSLCSPVHPVLSWTQRHSDKQTNALTGTNAYVTWTPPPECRPSYSSSQHRCQQQSDRGRVSNWKKDFPNVFGWGEWLHLIYAWHLWDQMSDCLSNQLHDVCSKWKLSL